MQLHTTKQAIFNFSCFLVILSSFLVISCSKDSENEESPKACPNYSDFIFNEKNGLVTAEFEDAEFPEGWILKTDGGNYSGRGYMQWEGEQSLRNPGVGTTTFKIKIENPGTYQFIWKSAVKIGDSHTDHNDTWLRFNDADDFYGQKEESIIYPNDTGKSPNPEGASKDGWFKIFRSGTNLDFKWQSRTSDNDSHDIFVLFQNPGVYTMEVSARSSGHAIDKFVLFNDNFTEEEATADNNPNSIITCL